MDDQLISEFLAEAEDLIEDLHGDVASLRAHRADGRARRELVGRIFRRVHTIKGTASAAGLAQTSLIAHELETLLEAIRLGRASVGDATLDAAEDAVAAIAASLDAVAQGLSKDAPRELIERLRCLVPKNEELKGTDEPDEMDVEASLPADAARALGEHERQRLREALSEGAHIYLVEAGFDLERLDEEFRRLSDSLGESGEIVASQPTLDANAPERISFRIIYASAEERGALSERVAQLGARLWRGAKLSKTEDGALESEGADVEGALEEESVPRTHASASATLVRVPLEALDELVTAARELSADAIGALDLALRLNDVASAGREELEARAARIRRGFFDLEERLKDMRVVNARGVLERAARVGRSAARALGKQVEFEIEGGDVRLDGSVAAAMSDALLHLVRNAVAHGIETSDERRALGKPERGRVRLEALNEDEGVVVLRVADDGRGVNAGLVAEAASARGIITPGARVSDEQALRLIFRPGFSTAAHASLVSGRGVGLDVVERAVDEAGGEVRVRSELGRGTTFELRLPAKPETRRGADGGTT